MTKKKWLSLIFIIAIVAFIIYFYISFNGNLITKKLAEKTADDYISSVFPDGSYLIEKGYYNFKDDAYEFPIKRYEDFATSPLKYHLSVQGFWGNHVQNFYLDIDDIDEAIQERFSEQSIATVREALGEPLASSAEIFTFIEVPKGKYASDVQWSKELDDNRSHILTINIDAQGMTEDTFLAQAHYIQKALATATIPYKEVNFFANKKETIEDNGHSYELTTTIYSVRFSADEEVLKMNIHVK